MTTRFAFIKCECANLRQLIYMQVYFCLTQLTNSPYSFSFRQFFANVCEL